MRRGRSRPSIPLVVQEALAAVRPPRPFGLEEYLARVARARGNRLVIHENEPLPIELCGMWQYDPLTRTDNIYVPRGAGGSHRWQIIGHEVGHMLMAPPEATFGHGMDVQDEQLPEDTTEWLRAMFPHMDQDKLAKYFGRTRYDEEQELNAELYGTLAVAGVHADDTAMLGRLGRIRQALDGL